MNRAVAAFAVLPLALSAQLAFADTDHVSRTFQTGPAAELRLKTFSGHVKISGGDTTEITVDAVRHGTREQLDAIRLSIDQQGSTVTIEANIRERSWLSWWGRKDVVDTDFEITVPRRTVLRLHSFSAQVDVNGTTGDAEIQSFSAPVKLESVAGPLDVHTFSGPVTVRSAASTGEITIKTFSGGVDLLVPDRAHAVADFRSFSGRLSSSLPLLFQSSSRRETIAELQGPGPAGHIRVKTFSGDLRIER